MMQNPDVKLALERDSQRTARYWVPGMALLLLIEAASHTVPFHAARVWLSLLSALVLAALSWVVWTRPEKLAPFRYWALIPWALPTANIYSHIEVGAYLVVVFSTMAILLCGALLTRMSSFAIALPLTAIVQIHSVVAAGSDLSAGFLVPVFSIPLSILLFMGRRRAIIESVRVRELEKALHDKSAQLSRYQGLARMSGYVAHHFSNMMSRTVVSSSMALETLGDDEHPSRMWMEMMKDGAEKTRAFTSPLARFAGYTGDTQTNFSASELVSYSLLRHYLPERVQFSCKVEDGLKPIMGNAVELLDCLLAVIDNAVEAVQHVELPVVLVRAYADAEGGTAIEVIDNGEGISDESLRLATEPFYTTRGRDRSGLGLAYARAIIDRHSGLITIKSKPAEGTCVTLTFPTKNNLRVVENVQKSQSSAMS